MNLNLVNVSLDQLKNFVAVGEELHFTRAAETRLHVSQPWLSRSVRGLEEKLGVQLFHRHSRHVELTLPGQRLLYGARKILHDFDRTVSAVVREKTGNEHLTVGYSPYVDLHFITELKEMLVPRPCPFRINFESSASEEVAVRVGSREWDCGIVILPLDTPQLDIIPLFCLPLGAAIPRSHPLARKRTLKLEDLENQSLILCGKRGDSGFRECLRECLAEAKVRAKAVEEAASPHEAQYLVTRGVGIAIANLGAFRTSPEGVVVRTLPAESLQTQTAMIVRKGKHSSTLETFVAHVIQLAKVRNRHRPIASSAA